MKRLSCFALLVSVTAPAAFAQIVPVPAFAPTPGFEERFDTFALGSYTGLLMMGGRSSAIRLPASNALVIATGPLLTPLTAPRAMFGRGTNVRIRFSQPIRTFGGWFRVPNAGVATTGMQVTFRTPALIPVGPAVAAPIGPAGWVWRGWRSTAPFQIVDIVDIGPGVGYVGMDVLRARL